MRVAVCISGFIRMSKETIESFQSNLVKPFKPDVFISTWKPDDGVDSWRAEVESLYRPVMMEVESWPEVLASWGELTAFEHRKRADVTVPSVLGMFYKIYRSNRLKCLAENARNARYDLVVRMRTDVRLYEVPDVSRVIAGYVSIGNSFGYGGLPDLFAYGDSVSMDVYSDLFSRISAYVSEGCVFHPEMLLEWHVKRSMPQGVVFSSVPYRLVRPQNAGGATVWTVR